MTLPRRIAALAGLLALVMPCTPVLAQIAPANPGDVRALTVEYADGRKTVAAIGSTGRVSWTTLFPRIAGADTAREGLPLNALQFEEAHDGQSLVVTLALLYGSPQQKRVPVTSVRVTGGEAPVRVDALESFGVRPVTLSIVMLPPAQLSIPSVTTPSSQLEVAVETVAGAAPAYHAVVGNHSDRTVMMLAFKAYRGNIIAASGRPRVSGKMPLIPSGGTYVLKLPATANSGAGPNAWLPLDRIEITSVLWSDGVVEGDPVPAADERVLDAGSAQQLTRMLAVLRAATHDPSAHPLAQLRTEIDTLSIRVSSDEAAAVLAALPGPAHLDARQVTATMESGMRNARSAVLNDVEEYARVTPSPVPSEYGHWLAGLVVKYDGWRTRIGTE